MTVLLAEQAANNEAYLIWGFVLLGIALLLVMLELFIPTGGLLAAASGAAIIGSITAFFMYDISSGFLAMALYMVLSPIAAWAIIKFWMNSPIASKMVLGGTEMNVEDDESDPMAASEQARRERLAQLRELIGAEGVTVTGLRPVGTVKINGQRIDAMAETGVIESNTAVIVTDVYDNQIKVRPK